MSRPRNDRPTRGSFLVVFKKAAADVPRGVSRVNIRAPFFDDAVNVAIRVFRFAIMAAADGFRVAVCRFTFVDLEAMVRVRRLTNFFLVVANFLSIQMD